MSLLDKQEAQDICGHTALCARKGADLYVNECQKIRHYHARSTEERRREEESQIAIFYFARCIRKIALYRDVIHSFDWKSAIEHDVKCVIVYLARDIPAFVMYCIYRIS